MKERPMQAGQLVLSYSNQRRLRMCGHHTQTYDLLILRSPQLSFTSRPYIRADMDLYRRYAGFSPVSKGSAMLSQSKHWSGGCRVCWTCSAAPELGFCCCMLEAASSRSASLTSVYLSKRMSISLMCLQRVVLLTCKASAMSPHSTSSHQLNLINVQNSTRPSCSSSSAYNSKLMYSNLWHCAVICT